MTCLYAMKNKRFHEHQQRSTARVNHGRFGPVAVRLLFALLTIGQTRLTAAEIRQSPREQTARSAEGRSDPTEHAKAIIFDTDMDSDCDDAAALAMLHALADRGEIELLAPMGASKHPGSPACTEALNTYFGRGDLPIGAPKRSSGTQQSSTYAEAIAKSFPHDIGSHEMVPDATMVYREVLASQPDESVTIVTVGDLTNLRFLVESEADEISPLSGRELVSAKVRQWVCMGSRYPADLDPNKWGNFKPDAESTVRAIAAWPTRITFTGGGKFAESLATGRRLSELPRTSPVRRVYELYFQGELKNRHSADQIAVMVAARGTGKPWKLVTEGYNHIFPNGTHEWRESPDKLNHEYISALAEGEDAKRIATEMEELMLHQPKADSSQ